MQSQSYGFFHCDNSRLAIIRELFLVQFKFMTQNAFGQCDDEIGFQEKHPQPISASRKEIKLVKKQMDLLLWLSLCSCTREPLLIIHKQVVPMAGSIQPRLLAPAIQPLPTADAFSRSMAMAPAPNSLQLVLPGERVGGIVPLKVMVPQGNEDTQVAFFLDQEPLGLAQGPEPILNWNSRPFGSGVHQIFAKIRQGSQVTQTPAQTLVIDHPPEIVQLSSSRNPIPGPAYPVQLKAMVQDPDTAMSQLTYEWDAGSYSNRLQKTDLTAALWFSPGTQKLAVQTYTVKLKVSDQTTIIEKKIDLKVNNLTSNLKIN